MERPPDVQYLVEKCVRRGIATYSEMRDMCERYDADLRDVVVEELNAAGVRLVDEKDVAVSPQTNVLMNDLALVELVSLALRLPAVARLRRGLYAGIIGTRSYELDLTRLGYLDGDREWYYLSPSFNRLQRAMWRLFDSGEIPFAKEWRGKEENVAYLRGLMAHALFADRVLPQIREHYLGLREVTLLVRWIRSTGKSAPVMVDIIRAGLNEDGPARVREVLFSNLASTAESALRRKRDVCFACPPQRRCLALRNVDDPNDVLVQYRFSNMDALLACRYPGEPWEDCVVQDWMIAKFFLPYSVVVSAKRWMLGLCILDSASQVLDKGHGLYCPKVDTWKVSNTIEVYQ